MIETSGYNIEGYKIDKYLGFITGESALGTGFLSSFCAGVADVLGENSTMYSEKLFRAKEIAIDEMRNNAMRLNANAIIGMTVSYVAFSSDIMGVIVSGTAVHINEVEDFMSLDKYIRNIPVINYYKDYAVPYNVKYCDEQNFLQIEMNVKRPITAINADIIFNTIFGTQYTFSDINFVENLGDENFYVSEIVPLKISKNKMKIIQSAIIKLNYCLIENRSVALGEDYSISKVEVPELVELRMKNGNDVVAKYKELQTEWVCLCGAENSSDTDRCGSCGRNRGGKQIRLNHEMIASLKNFDCVKDMHNFLSDGVPASEQIVNIVKKYANLERLYGNMKKDCIQELIREIKND